MTPKDDNAVGLGHALENLSLLVFRILEHEGHDVVDDFVHRLVKLGLARIALDESIHESIDFGLVV